MGICGVVSEPLHTMLAASYSQLGVCLASCSFASCQSAWYAAQALQRRYPQLSWIIPQQGMHPAAC